MKVVYKIANIEFEGEVIDADGLHFFKEKCWSLVKEAKQIREKIDYIKLNDKLCEEKDGGIKEKKV